MILTACSLTQKPIMPTPDTTAPATVTAPDKAETTVTKPVTKTPTSTAKSFTAAEVAEHSNGTSCWLILSAKVYDVTSFIPKHPGGEAILRGCGKDATQMFSRHPESAKAMKEQFYIGDLKL